MSECLRELVVHSREDIKINKERNPQLLFQFNKGSYSSQRLRLRSP